MLNTSLHEISAMEITNQQHVMWYSTPSLQICSRTTSTKRSSARHAGCIAKELLAKFVQFSKEISVYCLLINYFELAIAIDTEYLVQIGYNLMLQEAIGVRSFFVFRLSFLTFFIFFCLFPGQLWTKFRHFWLTNINKQRSSSLYCLEEEKCVNNKKA